jgi:hypothetical protein
MVVRPRTVAFWEVRTAQRGPAASAPGDPSTDRENAAIWRRRRSFPGRKSSARVSVIPSVKISSERQNRVREVREARTTK